MTHFKKSLVIIIIRRRKKKKKTLKGGVHDLVCQQNSESFACDDTNEVKRYINRFIFKIQTPFKVYIHTFD